MTDRRLAPAFLVLLALLVFSPFWLQGKYFVPQDFLRFIYPWKSGAPPHNLEVFDVPVQFYPFDLWTRDQLRQGIYPLWNPTVFAGHPAVGNGWIGAFYPPRLLLLWLFPAEVARTLSQLLHVAGAGLAMFFYLRRRAHDPLPAAIGAATWMLNSYLVGWMEFCHLSSMALWVPLMLLGAELASWRGWMLFALSGAMILHAGHVQFGLYLGPAIGLYALVRGHSRSRLALSAGLAVMLAAPMVAPFLELQRQCQRPAMVLEDQAASLASYLPTLLCPDVWGNPARGYLLNRCRANLVCPEFYSYFGFLPLALGLLALGQALRAGAPHRRDTLFWGAAALVSLWAASCTFPYSQLAHAVGFLATMIPSRILAVFVLAGSQLAARGAQLLQDDWNGRRRAFAGLSCGLAGAWLAVAGAAWVTAGPALLPQVKIPPQDTPELAAHLSNLVHANLLSNPQAYVPLVGAALALLGLRLSARSALAAFLVFTGLELAYFASVFSPTVSAGELLPATRTTDFLQAPAPLHRTDKLHAAFYCTLVPYGQQLMTGYESLYPLRYYRTLSVAQPSGTPLPIRSAALSSFDHPLMDALNLKYVVAFPGETLPAPHWRPGPPAECGLFENTRVLPRAYLVGKVAPCTDFESALAFLASPAFQPDQVACLEGPAQALDPAASGSPVELREYRSDRVRLRCQPPGPALLVLADQFYPGWVCQVDGQPAPIYAANGVLRGVYLTAGAHEVEFAYRPGSVRLGLLLAGIALVTMGLLSLPAFQRSRPA